MKKRSFFDWYAILLAVLTVLVGAALIIQCVSLYTAGVSLQNNPAPGVYVEPVYSRENVSAKLSTIAPLLWGYIAAVIVGLIGKLFAAAKKLRPTMQGKMIPAKQARLAPARIVILCVAAVFIVLGVFNGGLRDVLIKAINICTECIGLG